MNKIDFKKELNNRALEIDKSLNIYFNKLFDCPDLIVDSMKYSLFADGKRIRPILTKEFAKSINEDPKIVEPLAEAIEMIHTYSLIHDDLPAIDNDNFRRGKPTNHRVYGDDIATLAGDGLLNLAIERALEGVPLENPTNYIKAVKLIFYYSGINGMIGGQTADVISEKEEIQPEDINYIDSHKTGALLIASILSGVVPFIGIEDERIKHFHRYGTKIGDIFQIVDDILDVTKTTEEIGKDSNSDLRNQKVTYVSMYGLDKARDRVEELRKEALNELELSGAKTEFLEEFTNFLCNRNK